MITCLRNFLRRLTQDSGLRTQDSKRPPTPNLRPSPPVVYKNRQGLRVSNLDILVPPGAIGILIINCPGAVIEDNHIHGGRTCIQVEDSPGVHLATNILSGYANNPEEEGHGIQLRRSSGTITYNAIDRWFIPPKGKTPGIPGAGEDAINLYESHGTVTHNTITGHGEPAGNAVTIDAGCQRSHVSDNTIIDAGPRGVVFTSGTRHVCHRNRFVRGCTDAAIAVDRECYNAPPIRVDAQDNHLILTKGSALVHVAPDGQETSRI